MTDAIREAVENKRLRRLIDLTWGYAHEDESVPSTLAQDRLIAQLDSEMPFTVTDEMVEAAARVLSDEAIQYRISLVQGFSNHPRSDRHWIRDFTRKRGDDVIWDGGPSHDEMMAELNRIKNAILARAALQAALGAVR